MTGFPLAQIADVLPFSCVLLEPCCILPQVMLYLGYLSEPGAPCLLCHRVKMVDAAGTFSKF